MDYSLTTSDIPGATPSYRHHSKQIYTLLKKKTTQDDTNNGFHNSVTSRMLDSNQLNQQQNLYKHLNKLSSNPQIAPSLRKQRVGSLFQETLKNSNFNTRNLMGSWQSAQKQRTGKQFEYSLIQSSTAELKNPEKLQQKFQMPNSSVASNSMLYNYRKNMDHPPLMPFKDIQKMLDYSLGIANKARNKQLAFQQMQIIQKKDKHYSSQIKIAKQKSKSFNDKLSQSVILADSGLNSLGQLKKNDQQKLFDRKSPYFPHIYRDYDLTGYENKYSGNRYWSDQPISHYNIPSVKGAYIKKF